MEFENLEKEKVGVRLEVEGVLEVEMNLFIYWFIFII